MSNITSVFDTKVNIVRKIIEKSNKIQDNALSFLRTMPHKNISKVVKDNKVILNYEDLRYYLQYELQNKKLIDYPIVAVYWKLDYKQDTDIEYKINISYYNTNFKGSKFYNEIQPYINALNIEIFEHESTNMYSFTIRPDTFDPTNYVVYNKDSNLTLEIKNISTDKEITIDFIIQYWCDREVIKMMLNKYLRPINDYTNFMEVIGQSKNLDLLYKPSLCNSFGKLDDGLITEICKYLF